MTDPNDFTVPLQQIIGALENSVRYGVEQPATVAFFYQPNISGYDLPRPAVSILRVTGIVKNTFTVFHPAQYGLSMNRLVWHATTEDVLPPEGSRFEVEYTYRDLPSGLTDFNSGSVVGTLLRAVAREMTLLYNQMDEAYRRAFIDEANGVALDNVVALLGVGRNAPQKAKGQVTFFRKKAATETVVIPPQTRVADQSGRIFVTTEAGIIPAGKEGVNELVGNSRRVKNLIAQIIGVWPANSNQTEENKRSAVIATDDERKIESAKGEKPLPEGMLSVQYIPRSVTVAIEAVEPGTNGNVNAGAITIMPTPPAGVEGVTNEEPTSNGEAEENDQQLRERAKHALERAGNATQNAIKYAVLDVDGVRGAEVLDHQTDDAIPLGEVRVRYHGGDRAKVKEAVEKTRAAGVMAYLDEIVVVLISGTFYLIPDTQVPPNAKTKFIEAVKAEMEALPIGAPLALRRLNALAFNTPGIADVAEAKLDARRPDENASVPVTDPFLVARSEMVRPDNANIKPVFLARLHWLSAAPGPTNSPVRYAAEIQLLDESGVAVEFRDFSIDLHVTMRAGLKNMPDLPPERIGSFTHSVHFANKTSATLNITKDDMKGFNSETHQPKVEFVIAAAAYPGLGKIQEMFDVTK
ncbi:MAG TPA: baseplate J/gp47 family protein [Pyrinomonadaceae bacterium]|jgi:hypothetical protein